MFISSLVSVLKKMDVWLRDQEKSIDVSKRAGFGVEDGGAGKIIAIADEKLEEEE